MSGKAVEAAGDVHTLLLDKTGTITMGNRQATEFIPLSGTSASALVQAAYLASAFDTTPEGRTVIVFAEKLGAKRDPLLDRSRRLDFSAETRMSGVDLPDGRVIRKGAVNAVALHVAEAFGGVEPPNLKRVADRVAMNGATPLAVAVNGNILGVIALSDVVKGGIRERIEQLRNMGIHTVMVTGDNPMTAAAIAAQAGVDEFVAEVKPEEKLKLIRREQAEGRLVAMTGDGTNDAPALAQADVGVAMHSGTDAAKEAANLIDLDSDPDQTPRPRRHRQANADDPRSRNDLFDRQRCGQVLRYHPGYVHRRVAGPFGPQRHGTGDAAQRGALGADFQRAHHSGAYSAGVARRAVPADERRGYVLPESRRLWRGRADRTIHRHQADRSLVVDSDLEDCKMGEIIMGALRASLVTWALCGIAYPLALTGLGQWLMPFQSNGSLERNPNGAVTGSRLIGQAWNGPQWFHGRPSATTGTDPNDPTKTVPAPYNAASSTGSNLGPTNKDLLQRLLADRAALETMQPELAGEMLPADMLTTSASGLDPDISPANAMLQVAGVARARGVPPADINALLERRIAGRSFFVFGEPRVNVLDLNLALQRAYPD